MIRRMVRCLVVALSLGSAVMTSEHPVASQSNASRGPTESPSGSPDRPVVDESLGQAPDDLPVSRPVPDTRIGAVDGRSTVEVIGPGATSAVAAVGGSVLGRVDQLVLADVPADRIADLRASDGVSDVRAPVDLLAPEAPETHVGDGRGFGTTPLPAWNAAGVKGTGVKVAVIDLFDLRLLSTQIAQRRLPKIPNSHRRCFTNGGSCPFGTPDATHGNLVAELVRLNAPGVDLYLVEVGGIVDLRNAVNWLASQNVSVISMSSSAAFDGPGDGTGPSARVIDLAVRHGILWVNSVGNGGEDTQYDRYAGGSWRGRWRDADADGWLEFAAGDESLGASCGALFGLRWSDWGRSITDYDLYISDATLTGSRVVDGVPALASGRDQSARGAEPLEANDLRWLCNTDTRYGPVYDRNGDHLVALWVRLTDRGRGPAVGDELEIMVNRGFLEHSTSAGSASIPFADSENPGMLAVGGVDRSSGGLSWFSSHGPTNGGAIKPDISAPGCADLPGVGLCANDDGFAGTSASAPIVAGLAARVIQRFPGARPAQVRTYLTDIAFFRGAGGGLPDAAKRPNNGFGWGVVALPEQPPATIPSSGAGVQSYGSTRLFDTRRPIRATAPRGMRPAGRLRPGEVVTIGDCREDNAHQSGGVDLVQVTVDSTTRAGEVEVTRNGGGPTG